MTSKIDLNTFAADFEKMRKERDEAQSALSTMETTLEDYHTALAKVLGLFHEYAERHGASAVTNKELIQLRDEIESLHPILVLHDDVPAYGFTLECDVTGEITDADVIAQTCTVCRGLLDDGDEPGSGICSTCLRADAEERADGDEGGAL